MRIMKHFTEDGKTALCGKSVWEFNLIDNSRWVECEYCKDILLDRLNDGPWEMYACFNGRKFNNPGSKFYAENCCISDEEIIKVLVELDDNGEYWGWQDLGDNEPHMIWPSEMQLNMCFGSGYQYRVDRKDGRAVRLNITKKD